MASQEVQRAAGEALKDLTSNEKKQVTLEERRKHAKTKAKKLEKSLKEVSCRQSLSCARKHAD